MAVILMIYTSCSIFGLFQEVTSVSKTKKFGIVHSFHCFHLPVAVIISASSYPSFSIEITALFLQLWLLCNPSLETGASVKQVTLGVTLG